MVMMQMMDRRFVFKLPGPKAAHFVDFVSELALHQCTQI